MLQSYNTALMLLKQRLNRLQKDTSIDEYLTARLTAADTELAGTGIRLREADLDDVLLLVDYAAWQYTNRDKPGGMPEWLSLRRRERWLRERGGAHDP